MSEGNEFKVAGLTMPNLTTAYVVFLVMWGALFSIGSESDGSHHSWVPRS